MRWASQNAVSLYVNDVSDFKCRMITQPFLSTEWCQNIIIYRLQIIESCWIQSHQIILHSKYIVVQCKFKTQQHIIHANVCMRFTRWWKMRTPWAGYSHSNNNRNLDLCRVLHNIFYIMLLIIAWNRNRRIILYATEVF